MKKCIVIPDSFKGTMSSREVCETEAAMLRESFPGCSVTAIPVADGGEGTVDCFLSIMPGEKMMVTVKDAYGSNLQGFYGHFGDLAVVEMAAAAGMVTNERRDPMMASTYGVGQLINHAVDSGCKKIVIGLGGSCTNDAGAGMAAAIGTVFRDSRGKAFVPTGSTLDAVETIDNRETEKKLANVEIICMCDIDNTLFGKEGAAYVFAPQKGADRKQVKQLDDNLRKLSETVKREMKVDLSQLRGGGAAGGMGAGAAAFLHAELRRGIDCVLDLINFNELLEDCDLVVTGEGRMDLQSLNGKVVCGVSGCCSEKKVPVVVIAGCVSEEIRRLEESGEIEKMGIRKIYEASDGKGTMEELRKNCKKDLESATYKLIEDMKESAALRD